MLQFLPALILLLLQSQGYANRIGSDKVSAGLLCVGYRQSLGQPTNRAVREAQRALLVRLLETNSENAALSGHLLDLLQAIDLPVQLGPKVVNSRGEEVAKAAYSPPESYWPEFSLSISQRFRDGPFLFV